MLSAAALSSVGAEPSHRPKLRIVRRGPQPCADYDCGRTSTCTPAAGCLPAALKAEDAHEYYRSDTRQNGPCHRISGSAALVSTVVIPRRYRVKGRAN